MLDDPSRDYFADRSRALRARGLDADDDDTWAQPDYDDQTSELGDFDGP